LGRFPSGSPSSSSALPPSPTPSAAVSVAPPAPILTQAVDADTLLRDAQQAWRRHYYALAIDKARAALKADPGRQGAYEIIATSACALGDVADARLAIARLDEQKRRQVRSLCEKDGVKLD
jgi:Tfp pilus assembly protein PilF